MKRSKRVIFVLSIALFVFMAYINETIYAEEVEQELEGEKEGEKEGEEDEEGGGEVVQVTSLRGISSFLSEQKEQISCKKEPWICNDGSIGAYCCKNVCVDLMRDHENCGSCKNNCKKKQTCCKGRCLLSFVGCDS